MIGKGEEIPYFNIHYVSKKGHKEANIVYLRCDEVILPLINTSTMIFYFSANGNSKWVAHRLAEELHDQVCDILEFINRVRKIPKILENEKIGIVFPIHSWYLPKPVLKFLDKIKIPDSNYRYAVCTCGDDTGRALEKLNKTFRLDAAWSVIMPNTYIPMFNLDSDEVVQTKIENATARIPRIANLVETSTKCWDVKPGYFPWIKTYVLNPLFVKYIIKTKGFHIEGNCTSCGHCEDVCPMENVELKRGKPIWFDKCIHCMACVHQCPQKVIQYKHATQKRDRYRSPV